MKRHDDYGGFDRQDLIDIIEDQQADITKASAALAAAEKRITYLQNDNADRYTQIRELTKERDGLREVEESARYLISFITGEKDMDECENCRAKECCACCSTQASYLEKAITQAALKGGSDGRS